MNNKPTRKVNEPRGSYAEPKSAKGISSGNQAASDEVASKRITDKLFAERKVLLRKLAQ